MISAARPRIAVAHARDLGPQLTRNRHRMIGQDGAFSIPCGGRTLWFFGDTLIGRRTHGESLWYPGGRAVGPDDMSGKWGIERMLNNTGMLLFDRDGRNGLAHYEYLCDESGNLRTLIPLEAGELPDRHRIWCLHGICLGEKVVLFFVKVEMLPEGPFPVNFRVVGSGMAVGDSATWIFARVSRNGNCILWGADDPHFATAVLRPAGEEWLYLYGSKQGPGGAQGAYLARVLADEIDRPEAYQYLSSERPTWSPHVVKAIPIFTDMPNELSVSHNAHLGAFLAVHSLGLSGDIVARTAPMPWGPWSDPEVVWRVRPERTIALPYPPLVYAGKEHPALSREHGRIIYLSYVEFEEYYPHFIEITLE